ncbi:hypothetical protein [Streptomyces lydicus]|uniref:hypothetical protein n=1 Tax=Streptomyces lydicus TaxID=47763 RepID=UPI0013E32BDC|nr:hypothetical protein [Streptomyces lydicus]
MGETRAIWWDETGGHSAPDLRGTPHEARLVKASVEERREALWSPPRDRRASGQG